MAEASTAVFLDPSSFAYVVGIDIGGESCCFSVLTPQKQLVIKPSELANAASGFEQLQERLVGLGGTPARIVVGMEATSRDARESLSLSSATRLSPVFVASPTNP